MARRSELSGVKPIGEINMTPLMDLTFVLLITFIITFPMIENGIPITLPTGEAESIESEAETITVTVNADGLLFVNKIGLPMEQLEQRLVSLSASKPDTEIWFRADAEVPYGKAMEAIRYIKAANIPNLNLITDGKAGE